MIRLTNCLSLSLVISALLLPHGASAEVLYKYRGAEIFDGSFGTIAEVQSAINHALGTCGHTKFISVDGKFGLGTQNALRRLADCKSMAALVGNDPEARNGALTLKFWGALMGDVQAPSVDNRAHSLMLTYEATDYVGMEWNFCQTKPLYDPNIEGSVCYSNDPKSYLTWGPNGATAGGGREVQLILQAVDTTSPDTIDEAFVDEAPAVRRMFSLPDRDEHRSLETYLCGIWSDQARRIAWKKGFQRIGRIKSVREKFDELYKSSSLDGGKIANFYRAYSTNGLQPTEVDYAFFKDRAAHMTVKYDTVRGVIADFLKAVPNAARWQVRQAIALNVRPSRQQTDRLGRDVAFYIDGGEAQLSELEQMAWRNRGQLRASDVGLNDVRSYPTFIPGSSVDSSIRRPAILTAAEMKACPAAVLATRMRS
ncbi:hypothetical protein [Ochrobactrum soli]|uniref:Peptidoglycan binding-like domain-containing protein n=1 Tax=Ochrobactrum soli TaxID=2448455 RepID=A0A2P9HF79_9HYPH|nr:hypothetical protein [[Ochrobactrum] soli]SPL62745.1 hypothetical protein OHAE_5352 [[Ochrobactrum] soli]